MHGSEREKHQAEAGGAPASPPGAGRHSHSVLGPKAFAQGSELPTEGRPDILSPEAS